MSNSLEPQVIQKFRERVKLRDLRDDTKIVIQISGGIPSERISQEFSLSGSGKVNVRMLDLMNSLPEREASGEITPEVVQEMFQEITSSLNTLVPRSEARFLPDSVIGSVTFHLGNEEETLYFLVNEHDQKIQKRAVAPNMMRAIQNLRQIAEVILQHVEE